MSNRKDLMAALHEAHRILNETDEFEADNKTQRAALEATKVEHEQEKARLERTKAAAAEAEAGHQSWLEATERERTRVNAEIDVLTKNHRTLETQVAERRAESNNILAGIKALTARLKV